MYHVKTNDTKPYGAVIGIFEYCKNNKWIKPKRTIGTTANHLTDEMLTEFIEKYKPEEINLMFEDKRGGFRYVDFPIESLM